MSVVCTLKTLSWAFFRLLQRKTLHVNKQTSPTPMDVAYLSDLRLGKGDCTDWRLESGVDWLLGS